MLSLHDDMTTPMVMVMVMVMVMMMIDHEAASTTPHHLPPTHSSQPFPHGHARTHAPKENSCNG